MKHLNVLTATATLSIAAFIASLALGYTSLPLFLGAAMTWIVLLTVYAYTPTRERNWLPRASAPVRALAACQCHKSDLPLAA